MPVVDPVVEWIARLSLCLLFASAAAHKLRDPRAFVATLRDYRVVPTFAVASASAAVICAELALAAALLVPAAERAGAVGALGLLVGYTGAIAVNLARGRRHIDCGCLGPGRGQPLSPWLIARNAAVGVGPVLLLSPDASRPVTWIDAVTVAGGVITLALLWSGTQRLAAAFSQLGARRAT